MANTRTGEGLLKEKVRRAAENKERVIVRQGGKPVAAVLPYEDLLKLRELEKELEQLYERLEDEIDRKAIERLRRDPKQKPELWEEVKARHGW